MERRGKHDNGRVASPKSVPIYRKVYGCISKTLHSHLDVFVYSNSGGGGGGGEYSKGEQVPHLMIAPLECEITHWGS